MKMTNTADAVSSTDQPRRARPADRLSRPVRAIVGSLAGLLWPTTVEGGVNVSRSGPAIIAANHISFFDSIVLGLAVRRRIGFAGKAEYLDNWKTRRLLPALGMIPMERGGPRQALQAL